MPPATPTRRILLVDDDAVDRQAVRRLLGRDYTLSEADSGPQALQRFESERPDCVLLDYHLPGEDSLRLLATFVMHHVPVVICTGQGNEDIAVEAMKCGAQDYLVKSHITHEALHRALTNALEKASLARQLSEAHEELERFASVIAHDLKAPLARIVRLGQLVERQCRDKLEASELELLTMATNYALQLHQFVDALRAYTRVGRSATPLAPVQLSTVLSVVLDNLDEVIADSQARIDLGALPVVHGDEVALVQLFQNLLANALKFRGDVAPVITVAAHDESEGWHLTVADNGIGIAPEDQAQIFEPFKRAHTREAYEGSGLGLATCQRIVNQHHGRLWVESAPGSGTTFHIVLAPAPGEQQPAEQELVQPGSAR